MLELDLFRMCMPKDFIRNAFLPATTNMHLSQHLSMQECYKWLGCQFIMCCFQGIADHKLWWSQDSVDMYSGAPFHLNGFMTRNCFPDITAKICYTDKVTPTVANDGYVDRFHKVQQMLEAFNDHCDQNYLTSRLSCLDKSMSSWLSNFFPGFMCLP